jgi:hypothetical protein
VDRNAANYVAHSASRGIGHGTAHAEALAENAGLVDAKLTLELGNQPLLSPWGATKTVVPLDATVVSRSYQDFIVPPLPVETLAAVPFSQ